MSLEKNPLHFFDDLISIVTSFPFSHCTLLSPNHLKNIKPYTGCRLVYPKLYICENPNKQKYLQSFLELNSYSRKTENLLFLFTCIFAKIYAKFLRKKGAICFLLLKAIQRAIKSRNSMTGSGSKYRFSRVKVKQGIHAVCLRT